MTEKPTVGHRLKLLRLFALTTFVCFACASSGALTQRTEPYVRAGTLVAIVPYGGGIVVAADSRKTVLGLDGTKRNCDGVEKLIETKKPRTVAVVTGAGVIVSLTNQVGKDALCDQLATAPRILDIEGVVKNWLDRSDTPIQDLSLDSLMQQCSQELVRANTKAPEVLASIDRPDVFYVVLVSYEPRTNTSYIRSVRAIKSGQIISFLPGISANLTSDTRSTFFDFGEHDYFIRNVINAPNNKFYDRNRFAQIEGKRLADITREQAISQTRNMIEAASKTTTLVPIETGIGGPISSVVIGANETLERLKP